MGKKRRVFLTDEGLHFFSPYLIIFLLYRWRVCKHNWCKWRLSWLKAWSIQGASRISVQEMLLGYLWFQIIHFTWIPFLLRAHLSQLTTATMGWACKKYKAERNIAHSNLVLRKDHITMTWVSFRNWPSEWWGTNSIISLWSNMIMLMLMLMMRMRMVCVQTLYILWLSKKLGMSGEPKIGISSLLVFWVFQSTKLISTTLELLFLSVCVSPSPSLR